jgi:hypothetical protein
MEQEDRVKILLDVKDTLQRMYEGKKNQIEQLKQEMEQIADLLQRLGTQIVSQSFTSADTLIAAEDFIKQKAQNGAGTSVVSRKILSPDKVLLCSLQYEKNSVFIRFPSPILAGITPEKYIEHFIRVTMLLVKKSEPNLTLKFTKTMENNQEFIETITLQNIQQFDSFQTIYDGIEKMLSCTK